MEAATIIISASILINEDEDEGPPRFYAVASGTNPVTVHDLYMTNIDRVHCIEPYHKVTSEEEGSYATYEACDIDCHEYCVGGCKAPADPKQCMDCEADFFYFTSARYECMPDCNINMTRVQFGEDASFSHETGPLWSSALDPNDTVQELLVC